MIFLTRCSMLVLDCANVAPPQDTKIVRKLTAILKLCLVLMRYPQRKCLARFSVSFMLKTWVAARNLESAIETGSGVPARGAQTSNSRSGISASRDNQNATTQTSRRESLRLPSHDVIIRDANAAKRCRLDIPDKNVRT